MSSYAQDVKNELAHAFDADIDCLRAEFVALLRVGAKKIDGRLEFTTSNAAVARRVITLAKKFFPHVKPEVAAVRRKKLLKGLLYVVRFIVAGEVQNFFDTLDNAELLKRTRFKVAYVRGAFLAGGSVNRPEAQYFLQIVSRTVSEQIHIR
ncbi:MAG: DNA-binding protein WhiA, partial [Selenomonadaceae bacterium]|nr:DNA-binding protein WhiA [Selenomonadaceae bacterium]